MFIVKTELKLYFNKSLIICAAVLALLALLAGPLGGGLLYGESLFPQITLYVADNDNSTESRMLTNALKDYKKSVLKVETEEEEAAKSAVENGEADAALIIPENFFADVMSGANSDAYLYVNENNGTRAEIIKLAAFSLKEQLAAAQSGIYYVLSRAESAEAYNKYFTGINFSFLSIFMGRDLDAETVTAFGEVSNRDYYTFSFYVFMMLITPCLLIESGNAIKKGGTAALLEAGGVGRGRLFAYKLLSVFLVFTVLNIPVFGIMGLTGMFPIGAAGIITLFLAAVAAQTGFAVLFIWLFDETRSAGITIFVLQLASLFFSGGLIPLVFLPEALKRLCYLTPNYYITSLFVSIRIGGSLWGALPAALVSAAAVGLAYGVSAARARKGAAA